MTTQCPGPAGEDQWQCPRVPPLRLCSNAQIRDELLSPGPGPSTIITKLLIRAWCQELWGHLGLSTVEQSCWWQQSWLCPCFWFSIHCLYPWPGITSSRWSRFSAPSSSRGWDTNKWTQCATAQLQTCHQLIDYYQFVQLKNVFTLIGRAGKIKFLDIHLDKTRYKWQLIDVPKSDKTRLVLRRRGDGDTEPRCCILPALYNFQTWGFARKWYIFGAILLIMSRILGKTQTCNCQTLSNNFECRNLYPYAKVKWSQTITLKVHALWTDPLQSCKGSFTTLCLLQATSSRSWGRGLTRDEKAIQHGCQASPHWGNHVLNSFQDYTELTIFARIILLSWKATHRQSKTSIFLWWADTTSPPRHSPSLIQIENEAGCSSSGSRQILEILKNFIIVPIWIFRKMVISDYFVKAGADSRGAGQLSVLPAPPSPAPFLNYGTKISARWWRLHLFNSIYTKLPT